MKPIKYNDLCELSPRDRLTTLSEVFFAFAQKYQKYNLFARCGIQAMRLIEELPEAYNPLHSVVSYLRTGGCTFTFVASFEEDPYSIAFVINDTPFPIVEK